MLFSKPLQEISAADVQEICDKKYPETDQVEYKEFVPGRSGPDVWHTQQSGGISDYARDKLLAEIVAFANTHGGHLIIGIAETAKKPHRADFPQPLPLCSDLAERLRQAADVCISPAIGQLQIRGVQFDEADQGVIVVRVPASRSAPHRLETKQSEFARHCYSRRGDRTEALTMREIQDLTLNLVRGDAAIESRLGQFRKLYEKRSRTNIEPVTHCWTGIHCSAVPLQPLRATRMQVDAVFPTIHRNFVAETSRNTTQELSIPTYSTSLRPTLRGVSALNEAGNTYYEHSIYFDGSMNVMFLNHWVSEGPYASEFGFTTIYSTWALGLLASLLDALKTLSLACESPNSTFAVDMQLTAQASRPLLVLGGRHAPPRSELPDGPFNLPRYSYCIEDGITHLLNQAEMDLKNAVGFEHTESIVALIKR